MKQQDILAVVLVFAVAMGALFVAMSEKPEWFPFLDDEYDYGDTTITETLTTKEGVTFLSIPSGAEVKFEGSTYTTPTEKIECDPGRYNFEMYKPGYFPISSYFDINQNYSKTIEVNLIRKDVPDLPLVPSGEVPGLPIECRFRAVSSVMGLSGDGFVKGVDSYFSKELILKNADLYLSQVSTYHGTPETIEYQDETSTGWLEFESSEGGGQKIQYVLNSDKIIGNSVAGQLDAPDLRSLTYTIPILPKNYGFLLTFDKYGIMGDPLPCSYEGTDLYLASLGDQVVHKVYVKNYLPALSAIQGTQPDFTLHYWMFIYESPHQYAHLAIRGQDLDANYKYPGQKTAYIVVLNENDELEKQYRMKYTVGKTSISDISLAVIPWE